MSSKHRKIGQTTRIIQKQEFRTILILGSGIIGLVFLLMTIFNFSAIHNANANQIDIQQKQDQFFINEMALPAPFVKYSKQAGPNTIFVQQLK